MRVWTGPAALFALAAAGLAFGQYGDISGVKLNKPEDKQDVKSEPPPEGAVVLFDGKSLDGWTKVDGKKPAAWKLVDGGAVQVNGTGNIITKQKFDGNFKLHVEFRVPYLPDKKGQERGNSGVYLQGRYEVQVLDSYNSPTYAKGECGAIYEVASPRVNACKAPTVWQNYDIEFHAPVCKDGKVAEPPRVTVRQNGVLIHDDVKIVPPEGHHYTRAGMETDPCTPGPIMLQDHGNPVQYRNVWLLPLTKRPG
jgi:hypothetical protein